MKRNQKWFMTLMLIFVLTLGLFSGCKNEDADTVTEETEQTDEAEKTNVVETDSEAEEEVAKSTDPLDMILDGRYVYSFFAEGYGDFTSYFHFYEEAPVLGSVFYAGFSNNDLAFSGTYTVEEKEMEYALYTSREEIIDGGDPMMGTAPYTITFYDWDGMVLDTCGFDGEILYNDMEAIAASGSGPVTYVHDTDLEGSDYAEIYAGEVGVTYLGFVADEDPTSTLSLFHNMTYVDLTSMIVEGAWAMEVNDDGSYSYTLTPSSTMDTGASVKVAADKVKAEFASDEGTVLSMTNVKATGPQVVNVFEGVYTIEAYGMDAAVMLKLYDDDSCEATINVGGSEGVIDSGTYTMAADGYTFVITFETAGEIQSILDYETLEISLPFTGQVEGVGDIEATLTLVQEEAEEETGSSNEVQLAFDGGYTTFECYSDGTYIFKYADYDLEEIGTWAFDSTTYTFSITQDNGNVINATIEGDDHLLTLVYVAVASDQLVDTFTSPADAWGAALMQ